MSVNYTVPVLTSRLQLVANAIDAGGSHGALSLLDSGGNVLSTLPLVLPCATVANGVLTFNGLALIDVAAAASGIATGARCADSTGAIVFSGLTVGTIGSTCDIVFSPSNSIKAGQSVAITAATITGN